MTHTKQEIGENYTSVSTLSQTQIMIERNWV